ncbi:MAG: glucose-6-phosphate dehydrogenase [Paludibacteraceae bacterium]|nr:glucose-6-phosphate dehydrogenase [Paludibacteraceae bacterium]
MQNTNPDNKSLKPFVLKNNIDNQITVIFGSNGDLAKRKLIPALFELYTSNLLPEHYALVGCGSQEKSDTDYRENVLEMLKEFKAISTEEQLVTAREFIKLVHYQKVNNQVTTDFEVLKHRLDNLAKAIGTPHNYIYYYSIPPFLYDTVSANLAAYNLTKHKYGWKRVIVEKPFGYSYETAVELDTKLLVAFEEDQIYRIDHYLGKETVQNILVTRFSNGFFEPLWNRNHIDRVEITNAEKIGVGNRGGYYDTSGALRDMIQNHLLQTLAVVAMEPPVSFDSESIHAEKTKVFRALRPISEAEVNNFVIRGQYKETEIDGKTLKGYRQEEGVNPDSKTETYCAIKLFIDNWRWSDVPFYIRTGKYLPERATEVVIHLKPAPLQLFKQRCITHSTNMIILRIQPDESVSIDFGMKMPGMGYRVQNVQMEFKYSDLADTKIPEAYERLLLDCMLGDSTLYPRADALKLSWKFVDPILNAWKNDDTIPVYEYDINSWGPSEANKLYDNKFMKWRPITKK